MSPEYVYIKRAREEVRSMKTGMPETHSTRKVVLIPGYSTPSSACIIAENSFNALPIGI